ncbi:MAG: JAB domain-containing protein [Proteobacteria bacterium]|nr:JAB domain-containing protein [Pseudomonadota bacterium]
MFKRFHDALQEWLKQNGYLPLVESILLFSIPARETNPDNGKLWKSYLKAVIPNGYSDLFLSVDNVADSFAKELLAFSNYTIERKIIRLIENSPLKFLSVTAQKTLSARIVGFHDQLERWTDGHWHQEISSDRHSAFQKIVKTFEFETEWNCAVFLSDCGYFYPSSIDSFKAWRKWTGSELTGDGYEIWKDLLYDLHPEGTNAYKTDRLYDLLFSRVSLPGMPTLCRNESSCFICPLSQDCGYFKANIGEKNRAALENLIRTDNTGDISTNDLLIYLAGERWQASKRQQDLLSEFPDFMGGMPADLIMESEEERLFLLLSGIREISGRLAQSGAPTGKTSYTSSRKIFERMKHQLGNEQQESFHTMILDNKYRILHLQLITKGTLNQSLVHPREVFAPSIQLRAAAVVLIHNHPSGDPKPSQQDIEITKRLCAVGETVGINVIDHVVIGKNDYFSFADEDMMP